MKKSYLLSPVLAFAVMLSAVFLSCTGSGGGASVNGAAAARSAASLADSIALCLEKGGECYGKGDYTNALEYYVKGLKYSETGHNSDSVARFYKNIGNIYCLFEDYERGNLYYRDGLKYSRSSGDKETEVKLLINLVGIHMFMGKGDEARGFLDELRRVDYDGGPTVRFMTDYDIGLIQIDDGKYGEAIANYRRLASAAAGGKLGGEFVGSAYQQMYKAFMLQGRNDSALHYMRKCEQIADSCGIRHMFTDLLKDMSALYERVGDTASSLACKAAYLSLKDSVYNMRQFDAAKHAQFLYEMDKVEKEIATLQTQKERFRRTAGVLLLVVAAVTVFLVVIYRQKRKLDVSYASLYSVNRKYVDNSEKMKRRLADCAEALKAKDGEITRLRGELVDRDGDKAAASSKYQSSSLNDNQRQAIVEAITDAMENRMEFCSYDFSLDKLAELVGSNSKYVSQVINDTFNKNFSIFVNEYRINLACMRLADFAAYGNYTIRAIAESVGFTSYSTFNSVFRKFTGITPSIYQKMARREENMLVDG